MKPSIIETDKKAIDMYPSLAWVYDPIKLLKSQGKEYSHAKTSKCKQALWWNNTPLTLKTKLSFDFSFMKHNKVLYIKGTTDKRIWQDVFIFKGTPVLQVFHSKEQESINVDKFIILFTQKHCSQFTGIMSMLTEGEFILQLALKPSSFLLERKYKKYKDVIDELYS